MARFFRPLAKCRKMEYNESIKFRQYAHWVLADNNREINTESRLKKIWAGFPI